MREEPAQGNGLQDQNINTQDSEHEGKDDKGEEESEEENIHDSPGSSDDEKSEEEVPVQKTSRSGRAVKTPAWQKDFVVRQE